MSLLIPIGKKIKRIARGILTPPSVLSYARRINSVRTSERICAMTFDDGPSYAPVSPGEEGKTLTPVLLDILKHYDAKGTFDIIGTTADNYPDIAGEAGTPSWSGVRFDHYPAFGKDKLAGAVNCPELVRRIIDEGHQLSNHGYAHIIFGKKSIIYGKRAYLDSLEDAVSDIRKLNELVKKEHSYDIGFMRPAHYVDNIKGGFSSYDAIGLNSMQYLGASFDGAGWLPVKAESIEASYKAEVEACVAPLREALEKDPDALCGKIIFQKDGYNMALRTPVADALPLQLEILKEYGYRVVTVSDLMEASSFSDVSSDNEYAEIFKKLCEKSAAAYSDNSIRPNDKATRADLVMMACGGKEAIEEKIRLRREKRSPFKDVSYKSEYCGAFSLAAKQGLIEIRDGRVEPALPAFGEEGITRGKCAEKVLKLL